MKSVDKIQPGERIVGVGFFCRSRTGVMVRSAPKTALVRFDGSREDERVSLDSVRRETTEDIARRKHEAAVAEWRSLRPTTSKATVQWNRRYASHDETGVAIYGELTTPDEMRLVAYELLNLATWFDARPMQPTTTRPTQKDG